MKFLKKLFTFAIAFAMLFSLGTRVMAADGDEEPEEETSAYDETLTISGLTNGDTVRFFKLVKWVGDEATVPTDAVKGWQAISPMTLVQLQTILGRPATQADVDAGDADEVGEWIEGEGITSELAGQLAVAFKAETPVATVDATSSTVVFDVTADSDPDPEVVQPYGPGIYMALITPADVNTVYNPVFVSSDFNTDNPGNVAVNEEATYSDEAAAKKSVVKLEKEAKVSEENYQDAKWTTTRIGETVSFTVTTTIPGYGEVYQNPVFKITDKLTDLALDTDSVVVKVGGVEPGTPADVYTISKNASGYTIEFKSDYLKELTVPTAVEVTYDAIVTTDAPVHVNTEKNEVSTEFSHNPSDESDHEFKKDGTNHYTFTIDAEGLGGYTSQEGKRTSEIVKVGVDANGDPITETTVTSQITTTESWESPLEGAEFKLYTDEECTEEYIPLKANGTEDSPLVIKSDENGRMTIKGLDAGTYYLKEEKAPAGFIKDPNPAKVEIIAVTTPKDVTEYTKDGVNWISADAYEGLDDKTGYKSYTYSIEVLDSYTVKINGEETAVYHFTNDGPDAEIEWIEEPPVEHPFQFENTQGTELPSTGGMGTTLFYTIGGMLVIGAGILLVSRRRMAE